MQILLIDYMKTLRYFAGIVACLGSLQGGEMTLGFEEAEGFNEGELNGQHQIAVLGGTASIVTKGAAEGAQFLRFIPEREENALVLNLGAENAAGGTRAIDFSIRLYGPESVARLVMSYGQTLALTPVEQGVELDPHVTNVGVIAVTAEPDVWISVGIAEDVTTSRWDLFIDGKVILTDLQIEDTSDLLSDILVFTDGSLDLDAVAVSADGPPASTEILEEAGNGSSPKTGVEQVAVDQGKDRAPALESAAAAARRGNYARSISDLASVKSDELSPEEWDLSMAQDLAIICYSLLHEGRQTRAQVLGWEILQFLENPEGESLPRDASVVGESRELLAGRILEDVFADYDGAEERYLIAAALDVGGAERGNAMVDRVRRKRDEGATQVEFIPGGEG
jgi:hypothetical protein